MKKEASLSLFDLPKKSVYLLSKTTFVKGKQCVKTIYLNKFKPQFKDKPSEDTLKRFKKGRDFETDFKATFDDAIDLKDKFFRQMDRYEQETQAILAAYESKTIFEAAIIFDQVLILVDVLQKNLDGTFTVFEVKVSKALNEAIRWDLALQYYVASSKLKNIAAFNVVLKDENGGFKVIDMTAELALKTEEIKASINDFQQIILSEAEPIIAMGLQCDAPYTCDFKTYCSQL